MLHTVLSDMRNESDGFWQNPDVTALFERIERPNAVSRAYYDAEQLIEPFLKGMLAAKMNRSGDASGPLQYGEVPESLKSAYRLISELNETPEGLFGRILIVKDESEK